MQSGSVVMSLAIAIVLASAGCKTSSNGSSDPEGGSAGTGAMGGAGDAAGTSAAMGGAGGDGDLDSGGVGATGGMTAMSGGSGGMGSDAAMNDDDDASFEDDAAIDSGVGPLPDQRCLEGITDYVAAGPFSFEKRTVGSVKMWAPDVDAGCKVPVVHFANGTGAACSNYTHVLEHLASHGFLVACYESPQTGEGMQCIDAVETVCAEYPDLASTQQIGFTGHGTGGSAALVCTYRAEEKWGHTKLLAAHALPPDLAGASTGWMGYYAHIDSPVFMVNGSVGGNPTDGLVSEGLVRDQYEMLNDSVEAYWYEGVEATHIPIATSWIEESTVAWFRWKLLGDNAACEYVKAMRDSERWNLQEEQNAVACE